MPAPDGGWELPDAWEVLAAGAPVGIAVTDAAHRFVWVNDTLAGIHGVAADAHVGRTLAQVAPPVAARVQEALENVLVSGAVVANLDVAVPGPGSGSAVRSLRCAYRPIRDRGGRPGVVHFVQEVSEQRVAEQAGRRAAAATEVGAALAGEALDLVGTAARIAERVVSLVGDVALVSPSARDGEGPAPTALAARDGVDTEFWAKWARTRPPWTAPDFLDGVLRTGERAAVALSPAQVHELVPSAAETVLGGMPGYALMLATMTARGESVGVLAVIRHAPGKPFGEAEVRLLRDLADRAGPALATARLVAGQQRTRRDLTRLLRITETMLGRDSLADLLAALLPGLQEVLSADTIRVFLLAEDGSRLTPAGVLGPEDFRREQLNIPIGTGFAGTVAARREALVVDDAAMIELASPALHRFGVRCLAGAPLLAGDELVGVLTVGSIAERHFGPDDVALLARAADRIALAVGQVQVKEALRESQAHAQAVLDTAGEAIITIDDDGAITTVNRAGLALFGYTETELVGQNVTVLMPAPYRDEHERQLAHFRATGETRIIGVGREAEALRRNGTVFPIDLHVTEVAPEDHPAGQRAFTGIIRDITERRRAEEALRHQALHDPLTGLANRALFHDHLDGALARQARNPGTLAVLFLDLDRFKFVNDDLGHAIGDRLLVQAGQRLRDAVRPTDTIARLGGDEFAILLDPIESSRDVDVVSHRILDHFSAPFRVDADLTVTTSIGVAITSGRDTTDELLRQADAALYRAKERGRNRYELFDEPLRQWLHGRLTAENELREALARGQIEVFYQPLQSLQNGGSIDCVEALARWRHPKRGLLLAADFIPFAEDAGFITSLDTMVAAIACRQLDTWTRQLGRSPEVAVNLSPPTLASDDFFSELTAEAVASHRLWVEITESSLVSDIAGTATRLDHLRDLGVRIATDDFGTGHASLAYLKRFPIDEIKIDKTFVDRLGSDAHDTAIVTAVINLGHAFGVRIVAEGVETERQRGVLTDLGCDYAQGHLIAPALPAEDLVALLPRS